MKSKNLFLSPYPVHIDAGFELSDQVISDEYRYVKKFVLLDENTKKYCLEEFLDFFNKDSFIELIEIKSGEACKNLDTIKYIWDFLYHSGADRHSILFNLGGGVVGDLGGFAASTYMRGIRFVQIPTTLLAMVDASIGGKTGFNFNKVKNGIGSFADPDKVMINTNYLKTLEREELMSGYAELLKHALIADSRLWKQLEIADIKDFDWPEIIQRSVKVKDEIVAQDKLENSHRKKLNFGHTIGHALEMFFLKKFSNLKHGYAVAAGMICESYLSYKQNNLGETQLISIVEGIKPHYPPVNFTMQDIDEIVSLIYFDKKNINKRNQFSLLSEIGSCEVNIYVNNSLIKESLMFYLETYE